MVAKVRSVAHLNWLEERLGFDSDAFLRSRGWAHSSSHPGSYWLWSKEIDGKMYHVPKDMALSMEQRIEGDRCTCDEGYEIFEGCEIHGGWDDE